MKTDAETAPATAQVQMHQQPKQQLPSPPGAVKTDSPPNPHFKTTGISNLSGSNTADSTNKLQSSIYKDSNAMTRP